jgi:hypothetical protein
MIKVDNRIKIFMFMKESFEDLKTPCFFDAYKILDGYRGLCFKKGVKIRIK